MCDLFCDDLFMKTLVLCWLCKVGCHIDLGVTPQKTETCIVPIFLAEMLYINQDEQEGQKGPQVRRSIPHCQKMLCPPSVDPGVTQTKESSSLTLSLLLPKCYSISSQLNLHLGSASAFLVPAVPIGRLFLPLFVLMASNLHLISRLSLVTYGFKYFFFLTAVWLLGVFRGKPYPLSTFIFLGWTSWDCLGLHL